MSLAVKAKKDEPVDSVIRRFKKKIMNDQLLTELKKREYYKKPSVLRKEKKNEHKRKRYLEAKYADK